MSTPELPRQDQPEFASVTDLLSSVSARYNDLGVEARWKLREEGDVVGHKAALRARAGLIAGLPEMLEAYRVTGGDVPPEAVRFAAGFAPMAREFLDEDNTFGMGTLLASPGSRL